jgi:hypothetical protein
MKVHWATHMIPLIFELHSFIRLGETSTAFSCCRLIPMLRRPATLSV